MNSAFQLEFTRTSNDGQFSFSVLPIVRQNDALNVLTEAFYPCESVCKAIKLSENAKAVDEINELVKEVIKDGVSVMAVDTKTNDIVGVSINKLLTLPTAGETSLFEKFMEGCKEKETKIMMQFLMDSTLPTSGVDEPSLATLPSLASFSTSAAYPQIFVIEKIPTSTYKIILLEIRFSVLTTRSTASQPISAVSADVFEYYNTDKLVEITLLAVLPEFSQVGLGYKLVKADLELLAELHENFDGPDVLTALATSTMSSMIGAYLDFELLSEYYYDQMEYGGIKFSDVIDSRDECARLACKRLEKKNQVVPASRY
ncbi:hypothetical protein ACFE04_019428 [Oxalis oulophora]